MIKKKPLYFSVKYQIILFCLLFLVGKMGVVQAQTPIIKAKEVKTVKKLQLRELRPTKIVGSVIMSSPKKDYSYYALSQKSSTSFQVEGPAKLTVYVRVRIDKDSLTSKPFHLKYILDKKVVRTRKIRSLQKSTFVKYKTKLEGAPTKAKKIVIEILPGKHIINFKKYKTTQKVHARFLYKPLKKSNWKEIKPLTQLQKVKIKHLKTAKEKSYYRIDNKQVFQFKTGDSTRIKIYLREDFTYKMYAEDILKLELKENGELIHTYKLTCKKTNKVEYVAEHKLMPGALKKIYLKPDGKKHTYELSVTKKNKSGIVRIWKSN